MNTRQTFAASTCVAVLAGAAWAQTATPPAPPKPQPQPQASAADQTLTESDVIAGTMDIDFTTRTNLDTTGDLKAGSAALGAQDKYKFNITVAKTVQFTGEILRQPNLYSSVLQRRKQDASLIFDIVLSVLNPRDLKQKKTVGNWVGLVPIDTTTGAYILDGGAAQQRPLRVHVDAVGTAPAFDDHFKGKMVGKAEKKDNLASYTYKRWVGNKSVQITVKQTDPMRFDSLVLAKGPAEIYPNTTVTGRLDYDYETGNWLTDGIRFRYTLNGREIEDILTGSIKWVEDPNRDVNGKGYYEFNLRFNEEKNKSASDEGAAFENLSSEEAFFAIDDSIPCLTGRIEYVDVMSSGSDLPSSSKVTYHLNANNLTKPQIMNFFKLWMIGVGPTNDE
ncbi:MAG: hypothetical protein L0219_02440 [Phycisphaerales bacterium]|nr:hypothetical protein [Phycisphaerales bacterium]